MTPGPDPAVPRWSPLLLMAGLLALATFFLQDSPTLGTRSLDWPWQAKAYEAGGRVLVDAVLYAAAGALALAVGLGWGGGRGRLLLVGGLAVVVARAQDQRSGVPWFDAESLGLAAAVSTIGVAGGALTLLRARDAAAARRARVVLVVSAVALAASCAVAVRDGRYVLGTYAEQTRAEWRGLVLGQEKDPGTVPMLEELLFGFHLPFWLRLSAAWLGLVAALAHRPERPGLGRGLAATALLAWLAAWGGTFLAGEVAGLPPGGPDAPWPLFRLADAASRRGFGLAVLAAVALARLLGSVAHGAGSPAPLASPARPRPRLPYALALLLLGPILVGAFNPLVVGTAPRWPHDLLTDAGIPSARAELVAWLAVGALLAGASLAREPRSRGWLGASALAVAVSFETAAIPVAMFSLFAASASIVLLLLGVLLWGLRRPADDAPARAAVRLCGGVLLVLLVLPTATRGAMGVVSEWRSGVLVAVVANTIETGLTGPAWHPANLGALLLGLVSLLAVLATLRPTRLLRGAATGAGLLALAWPVAYALGTEAVLKPVVDLVAGSPFERALTAAQGLGAAFVALLVGATISDLRAPAGGPAPR